jgi:hypothetical protein
VELNIWISVSIMLGRTTVIYPQHIFLNCCISFKKIPPIYFTGHLTYTKSKRVGKKDLYDLKVPNLRSLLFLKI